MTNGREKCSSCEVEYPEGYLFMEECGLCGLERMNYELGMDRKKFQGEMAEELRQNAVEWIKKNNIKRISPYKK